MDGPAFQHFVEQLPALTRTQLQYLSDAAQVLARRGHAADILETARRPLLACPRCACEQLWRDGQANGLQRFRCRQCRRTFNSLTGTPLARLRHKDKWLDYCNTLRDPATTVRRSAEQVGVHRNTTFRWRHRMLTAPRQDVQTPLRGIVEADEMFVLESQKGARRLERPARKRGGHAATRGISKEHVCVLVARDRDGRTHDAITGRAAVTAAQLGTHLGPALAEDVLLVTDCHPAYGRFARDRGIRHATINVRAGEYARGDIHVQNVNSYHRRLRQWLAHFRGVATRYLDNYCGWRRAIDEPRINSSEAFLRAAAGVFRS